MAKGRSRSSTCAQTSQVSQKAEIHFLSTAESAKSRDPIYSSPSCSKEERNAANLPKNDFNTMLATPARKEQETSNSQRTPKSRQRDVTSTSTATDKKQTRQDSAYSSTKGFRHNESELDGEVPSQQTKTRQRIALLRHRVLQLRELRRRRRDELHQLRENVREILDKFTRKINELVALGKLSDDVGPLYERLRAAQDILGPAEDAYDNLERGLDREEETLEQEEDDFYDHSDPFPFPASESKIEEVLSPLVKDSELPETEIQNLKLDDDPVQDYLAKVEEAYRLRDDLEDLEDEYCKLVEQTEFRKRHDIALYEGTTNFLKEYPQLRKDIIDNLQQTEKALFNLRKVCLQQGLLTDSEHIYDPHDLLFESINELLEEIQDRSPLHVAARHFDFPKHADDFSDKRKYVNVWLLGWVQESPVDALRLKNWICVLYPNAHNKAKELDDHNRWSDLALENWSKDSMGVMTSEFYNASRLDAIAGELQTGRLGATSTSHCGISSDLRSLDVVLDDAAMVEVSIMGSETGSYATRRLDNETSSSKLKIPPISQNPSHTWPLSPKSEVIQVSASHLDQKSHSPVLGPDYPNGVLKGPATILDRRVKNRSSWPSLRSPELGAFSQ